MSGYFFAAIRIGMAILLTGGGEMRSPEALKPRETHRTPNWPGAELSMETIRAYLADLSGRGRRKGTVQMYSAKLRALYDYLPPDCLLYTSPSPRDCS